MEQQRISRDCTIKEYRKHHADPRHYKDLKNNAVVGYVLVGINALAALLLDWFALVDCICFLVLVLGIHLKRSKGCAVGLLVYSIAGILYGLLVYGSFRGWMWLIVAIGTLKVFKKIDADYHSRKPASPEF